MPKKKEMMEEHPHKHKGKGWMMLIFGLLVLGNAYWSVATWPIFFGVIIAVAGLIKVLMPKCC